MWERSAALIPVETPSRASTEIVYAVRIRSRLCGVISGISSRSSISAGIGHADHPAAVPDRERHQLRRRLGGREDQVALVLAVDVVDDHDRLAGRDVGDRAFDAVQPDAHQMPPAVSWSRLARTSMRSRCGWPAATPRSPRSRGRRRRRRGSPSGSSWLCHSRGTPTRSTAIQASQKSVQPRAIAKVATMEPDEDPGVAPEVPALHREAGADHREQPLADHDARRPRPRGRPAARRAVAQRGVIAGADSARWDLLCCQRHQP